MNQEETNPLRSVCPHRDAEKEPNGSVIDQVVGKEPSPEFVEGVIDQCEKLLDQQGDDR